MVSIGNRSIVAVALAGIVATSAASAQAPAAQAIERWQVDGSNDLCTLIRTVAAPQAGTLFLQTYPGTDEFSFAVSSKSFSLHTTNVPFPVAIVLHDADARFDKKSTSAHLENDAGSLMRFVGLDGKFVDAFAHSSSVSFERSTGPIGPFAYRGAVQAVKVLNACVDQRLTDWGADPAQFQPGGKKPVPLKKEEDFFSRRETFDLMRHIDRHHIGPTELVLRMTIAADGSVTACRDADDKHGQAEIEKAACGMLLSRQLYEPARDPAGKAVVGIAAYHLTFMSGPHP
jgi:hypothetical protein